MRRRSIVQREIEIERLMALRRHHLPPALERRIRERLFREAALMWRTRLLRSERITVLDEVRNALAIVETSILPALDDLYESWAEAAGTEATPPVLTLGSWLGGDRDGHPGVNAGTLKAALAAQARVILKLYGAEVEALVGDLTLSSVLAEGVARAAGAGGAVGRRLGAAQGRAVPAGAGGGRRAACGRRLRNWRTGRSRWPSRMRTRARSSPTCARWRRR
jgi:phosphoenolpyruvate carboxylase